LGCFDGFERICGFSVWECSARSQPANAAVAAINAAINALAKAFAEQGIKDRVQVNSVSPGAVMTGRRQAFFEKWAPAHNLTVEEAIKKFPEQAGITRFGKPEEIADLMSYLISPRRNG
jgi:3-oxoacyl-[acyl-carrier protein] reductase